MKIIETNIEVDAPLDVVYSCWTNFRELPKFLDEVHSVSRRGGNQLRWRAEIFGATREGDIEIEELIPNKLISWRSASGARNSGALEFEGIDFNRTNIVFCLIYEEESAVGENSTNDWEAFKVLADRWLNHFKTYIKQQKTGVLQRY